MIRRSISGLTSGLIWTFAALLAAGLASTFLNPSVFPLAGFLSLLIAPLILINFTLLIYALIRTKRAGWASLIALLLAIPQIGHLWGFNFLGRDDAGDAFSLMTYNVRNFDLYNWSENEASRERIFTELEDAAPDVICFQEFYSVPGGEWDNIARCKEQLGLPYHYFSRELVLNPGRQWGIATFSRFPIASYGEIMQVPEANSRGLRPYKGIYTDLVIGADTVRIINIHLASIYLGRADYTTLENLREQQDLSISRSRSIVYKILKGYRKRGSQVRQLERFLEEEPQPHPVVICGDFNDTPTSFAYRQLARGRTDAWLTANWGPGATYNGPVPALRIDQILADPALHIAGTRIVDLDISDHLPLMTRISLQSSD